MKISHFLLLALIKEYETNTNYQIKTNRNNHVIMIIIQT